MAEGDDVPVEQLKNLEVDDADESTPGYKPPAKVDVKTIQELDADDESLVKYKQQLLGQQEETFDEGGPNVLLKTLTIKFRDSDNKVELDLTKDLKTLKDKPVSIKEGVSYRLEINFRVQREIVSGLRLFNEVYRKGVRVDKSNYMVGSYGPKKEAHTFVTPYEDAPKGMLARGSYVTKSKFTDDDKNAILQWEWGLKITKD